MNPLFNCVSVTNRKLGPQLLLHSQIPKPLHQVNPRSIYGPAWWEVARRKAYERAEFKCEACGVHKDKAAWHHWLEAHEVYDINFKTGRVKFLYLVALCHACHNFIHQGRMRMLVQRGAFCNEKYKLIMMHGTDLINKAKIKEPRIPECKVKWGDWRLVLGDQEYAPKFASYDEWAEHYNVKPCKSWTGHWDPITAIDFDNEDFEFNIGDFA